MSRISLYPILLLLLLSADLTGQDWTPATAGDIQATGDRDIIPERFQAFSIEAFSLRERLWQAPGEQVQDVRTSPVRIAVGLADGTTDTFRIVRYDMMESGLAAAYPGIRTFRGLSVSNPYRHLRADWTVNGFRAVVADENGRTYIDPFQRGDTTHVIVYRKQDFKSSDPWACEFEGEGAKGEETQARVFGDCQFRTYRLACAATGEYSNYFGAFDSTQANLVLSQIVTAYNRVNEVYEVDLAVRLVLIANTPDVFYYNPATDPYSGSACTQLGQNQTTMTNVIGSANYDIGHVFSIGSGGCAGLGVICNNSNKARGATGLANPTGDPFYIDYVAHEVGHQFGGNHTQNQTCNRVASAAYEPGSASTIMGYAGICPPNVQSNSDDYFHAISLLEMHTKILSTSCHQTLTFSNDPPDAGNTPNYTIPISTPFVLTGNGSDPNGDPIKYCWEQYDLEATSSEPPAANDPDGPLFRTFDPTTSPSRYFPRLQDLVNNTSPQFEVLPSVSRPLNFRLTVRDYHNIGGCSDHDDVTVTVTNTSGPFQVSSQNSATNWTQAQDVTVTWNVANTTASPVSCATVDVLFSTDGGLTYPDTLVSGHPNDGSVSFDVPTDITTTTGRVMVKANGNIFFDINNANLTVSAGSPTYTLSIDPTTATGCNTETIETTINVGQYQGYSGAVTLSALNLPAGAMATFSPPVVTPGNSATLTLSNLAGISGTYNILVQGSASTGVKQREFLVTILGGPAGTVTLNTPANNAANVLINPLLGWSSVAGVSGYDYQIALDNAFNTIVQSGTASTNEFQVVDPLEADITYYWRVRPTNSCGSGDWSSTFAFTTTGCYLLYSTDVPVLIPASGTPTVTSDLVIPIDLSITDLDVIDLEGTHTYMDDLEFTLIAPSGTSQLFWDQPCASQDNFDINLDDEAANGNWPCPPTNGMTYQPDNPLSVFDGLSSEGTWVMQVHDVSNQDGGSLNKWALKVCGTPPCQLVVNQTGPSGPGSLRAALECAEAGDTIILAPSLQGQTIDIGPAAQTIGKDLTILAGASGISISGTGLRVFEILAANQVLFEGWTLLAGLSSDGGAVINAGDLRLKGVTILANPGMPGAVLVRNDPGAALTIGTDCQIQQ